MYLAIVIQEYDNKHFLSAYLFEKIYDQNDKVIVLNNAYKLNLNYKSTPVIDILPIIELARSFLKVNLAINYIDFLTIEDKINHCIIFNLD